LTARRKLTPLVQKENLTKPFQTVCVIFTCRKRLLKNASWRGRETWLWKALTDPKHVQHCTNDRSRGAYVMRSVIISCQRTGRAGIISVLLLAGRASAHLDTLTQVLEPDPLVQTVEAETAPASGATRLVEDNKARGGKARVLGEGGGIRLEFGELPVGMHCLWVCARIDVAKEGAIVPGPSTQVGRHREDLKPLYLEFRVNNGQGVEDLHRLRVAYSPDDTYEYITRFYFHTPVQRVYRGLLSMGDRSVIREVYIDFVELRNPLGRCVFKPVKTRRTRFDAARIRQLRHTAFKEDQFYDPYRAYPLTTDAREQRDTVIWENFLPSNAQLGGTFYGERLGSVHAGIKELRALTEKKLGRELGDWRPIGEMDFASEWGFVNSEWDLRYTMKDYRAGRCFPAPWPFPEDGGGFFCDKDKLGTEVSFNYGRIGTYNEETRLRGVLVSLGAFKMHRSWFNDLPNRYLLAGDHAAAADGAFLLVAYAYHYPSYDWCHAVLPAYRHPSVHAVGGTRFYHRTSAPYEELCDAYDKLFPYIHGNETLARRVGRFVSWVESSDDVVSLIDTFMVQRMAQDALQHVLYSPALPAAAVTLGPSPESDRLLDMYFQRAYLRDTLCGFPDSMIGGFSRDGLNFIGSTFYTVGESTSELYGTAKLLGRYVQQGGAKRFDLSDPRAYPRLGVMGQSILGLHIAGGYRVGVGDVNSPDAPPRPLLGPQPFYLDTWRWTRDPRIARLLVDRLGQGDCPEPEWQAIAAAAEGVPDPILHSASGVLEGFGVARLEEGSETDDLRHKNAVMLRFGVGSGHAHPDTLDLEVFAHGVRMSGDMGGRVMSKYGRPSCMSQLVHNLVNVDGRDMNGGPKNSTGTGWLNAFKPYAGAQYVMGSGYAESHPQVRLYNRGVLQVLCDPGDMDERTPSAYIFDVFRVAGGSVHTWGFHGCVSEKFACNAELAPASSDVALQHLKRHQADTKLEGSAPDLLTAEWQLRRTEEELGGIRLKNSEKKMLGLRYDPDASRKTMRVTLSGQAGARVMVGNWYADKMKSLQHSFPLLYVRREGEDLESCFPAIIEPYAGAPIVTSVRRLPVSGAEPGVAQPVAMELITRFGQTDFLFAAADTNAVSDVPGKGKASGQLSFISRDADGLRLLHLVGGTELVLGDVSVHADRAVYQAAIRSVDYVRRTVVLRQSFPEPLLLRQQIQDCLVDLAERHGLTLEIMILPEPQALVL